MQVKCIPSVVWTLFMNKMLTECNKQALFLSIPTFSVAGCFHCPSSPYIEVQEAGLAGQV